MQISGSGSIAAGEYNDKISISGSGKLDGNVRCLAFACSGAASCKGSLECAEIARVSGSVDVGGELRAKEILVSGSLSVKDGCNADEQMRISGGLRCGGIKCGSLHCSGSVSANGEIAAEEIRLSGKINCGGLVNAERIEMKLDKGGSHVGSIGGSDIRITVEDHGKISSRLPLLSKLMGRGGILTVDESIEGDLIAIEKVNAPLVVGRIVAIGAGCEIELVQYSEEIEIHPDAKVERYEKI